MNGLKSLPFKINTQTIIVLTIAIGLFTYLFAITNAQSPEVFQSTQAFESTDAFEEATSGASDALTCVQSLPEVTYLGEYPGDYELPAGYDTFVVKRHNPFRFDVDAGTTQNGQQVYTTSERQRVWACSGECDFTAFKYEPLDFGNLVAGTQIKLIVLDDDGLAQNNDQRRDWWAANDPMQQYEVVEDQQLTEFLDFTVPFDANWYFYAADSIGLVVECVEPPATETPTVVPTVPVTPTETPTAVPTVPETPTETPTAVPTVPVTPTETPTAVPTVPETPTETPTAVPTVPETPTETPTFVPTVPATPTETATATNTPPVVGVEETATPTPIPTVVLPPTAIELVGMNASFNGDQAVVSWETSGEIGTLGFNIWRSTDGSRQSAVQLTTSLIASRGGTGAGATYEFVDTTAQPGIHYTYWVQELDLDGTTQDAGSTRTEFIGYFYLPYTSK